MNEQSPYPRTTITVDGELCEALDNALHVERQRGNKFIKNRSQLAAKWLWEKFREWTESLEEEGQQGIVSCPKCNGIRITKTSDSPLEFRCRLCGHEFPRASAVLTGESAKC